MSNCQYSSSDEATKPELEKPAKPAKDETTTTDHRTKPIVPWLPWPEGAEIVTYTGRCFCGKYSFTVKHPLLEVHPPVTCNCTFCTINPYLVIYAEEDLFKLTTHAEPGDDGTIGGLPHRKVAVVHQFCERCSSNIYWRGGRMVGVNVRLFDNIDITKLKLRPWDGRSL